MRNLHFKIRRGVYDIAFTFSLMMLLTAYISLSFSVMIAPPCFSNHLTALITEYCDPNCVLCPFSLLSLQRGVERIAKEPFFCFAKINSKDPALVMYRFCIFLSLNVNDIEF